MSTFPLSTGPAGPTASVPAITGCYLICLGEPYFHAWHYVGYVGYADDIARRIETQRKGQGSPCWPRRWRPASTSEAANKRSRGAYGGASGLAAD